LLWRHMQGGATVAASDQRVHGANSGTGVLPMARYGAP
jgi:hypothetical protein